VEKLAALIPPPRANQVIYSGVLAGNAALRGEVVPKVATSTEAQRTARAAKKLAKLESKRSRRAEEALCWAELLYESVAHTPGAPPARARSGRRGCSRSRRTQGRQGPRRGYSRVGARGCSR